MGRGGDMKMEIVWFDNLGEKHFWYCTSIKTALPVAAKEAIEAFNYWAVSKNKNKGQVLSVTFLW